MWKRYQTGKYKNINVEKISRWKILNKKVENIRTQGGILSSQFEKYQIQM